MALTYAHPGQEVYPITSQVGEGWTYLGKCVVALGGYHSILVKDSEGEELVVNLLYCYASEDAALDAADSRNMGRVKR